MKISTNTPLPWWGEIGLAMLTAGVFAGIGVISEYIENERRIANADSDEAEEADWE